MPIDISFLDVAVPTLGGCAHLRDMLITVMRAEKGPEPEGKMEIRPIAKSSQMI